MSTRREMDEFWEARKPIVIERMQSSGCRAVRAQHQGRPTSSLMSGVHLALAVLILVPIGCRSQTSATSSNHPLAGQTVEWAQRLRKTNSSSAAPRLPPATGAQREQPANSTTVRVEAPKSAPADRRSLMGDADGQPKTAIGRLYNLLFPSPPALNLNLSAYAESEGDLQDLTSADSPRFASTSGRDQQHDMISLAAPYESRARPSLAALARERLRSARIRQRQPEISHEATEELEAGEELTGELAGGDSYASSDSQASAPNVSLAIGHYNDRRSRDLYRPTVDSQPERPKHQEQQQQSQELHEHQVMEEYDPSAQDTEEQPTQEQLTFGGRKSSSSGQRYFGSRLSAANLGALEATEQAANATPQVDLLEPEEQPVEGQSEQSGEAGEQQFVGGLANGSSGRGSADDVSFLTAHLPSQYDAVIRLPPDGYYDDYFKPAQVHESNANNNHTGAPTSTTSNNYSDRQQHQYGDDTLATADLAALAPDEQPQTGANYTHHLLPVEYQTVANSSQQFAGSPDEQLAPPSGQNHSAYLEQQQQQQQELSTVVSARPPNHQTGDDHIQIIMANTNSSTRDPLSNEKVINYISEQTNTNITSGSGKSPRMTFVNQDMNEYPPADEFGSAKQKSAPAKLADLAARNSSRAYAPIQPANQLQTEPPEEAPAGEEDELEDERREVRVPAGAYGDRRPPAESEEDSYTELGQLQPQQQQQRRSADRNPPRSARTQREKPNAQNRVQQQQQQRPLRRPQVTQVQLNARELAKNPPTPSPLLTEPTVNSVAEIPNKLKRLRDNQPDKNELMNELLTALDRVKIAIYKLQPLTAKMNAIYRKSVTSNTRDLVMDHNKGTYAKRYPPGDYDDTYDRIHPIEQLERASARNSRRASRGQASRAPQPDHLHSSGSVASAVYLPAPKEVLDSYFRSSPNSSVSPSATSIEFMDAMSAGESQIVATGIGRRLGGGYVRDRLSLSANERSGSAEDELRPSSGNASQPAAGDRWVPSDRAPQTSSDGQAQRPMFGYRITIFQSPQTDEQAEDRQLVSYQVTNGSPGEEDEWRATDEDDVMVTSESSVSEVSLSPALAQGQMQTNSSRVEGDGVDADVDELEVGESGEKKKKSMSEKKKKGKHEMSMKKKKKKGEKKKEEGKKSKEMKKKHNKAEEESKKKKEYKKIKHNKGVISKEKKVMKRDKHIKAHDRGAAKEKALKERTQIEFFEREQIVDDEFEKGKKSTVKAGWSGGHDAKKTTKESSAGVGDTISSGGSHYVKHEPQEADKKSHSVGTEASSGKKSNKFEKKQMEAKGKKFKGWREKGYKIITETEFIDRGSLHDSAYKKRDKGAAHHAKYKKQAASSEGHHGSMSEHHKKSHKKEEKKEKMAEKKAMMGEKKAGMKKVGKKEMKQMKDMKKKKNAAKKDHKHEGSAPGMTSVEPDEGDSGELSEEPEGSQETGGDGDESKGDNLDEGRESVVKQKLSSKQQQQQQLQPILLVANGTNGFRAANPMDTRTTRGPTIEPTATLMRLLSANHDESGASRLNILHPNTDAGQHSRAANSSQFQSTGNSNLTSSDLSPSNRRSDGFPASGQAVAQQQLARRPVMQSFQPARTSHQQPTDSTGGGVALDKQGNATILDIVDNLTGRQVNKTKIGTYDLGDEQHVNQSTPVSRQNYPTARPAPTSKVNQQAMGAGISNQSNQLSAGNSMTLNTSTQRLQNQPKQQRYQASEELNTAMLMGLLQTAAGMQRQQQKSARQPLALMNNNQRPNDFRMSQQLGRQTSSAANEFAAAAQLMEQLARSSAGAHQSPRTADSLPVYSPSPHPQTSLDSFQPNFHHQYPPMLPNQHHQQSQQPQLPFGPFELALNSAGESENLLDFADQEPVGGLFAQSSQGFLTE